MFVTHLIMKAGPVEERNALNNLKYVTAQIAGEKKATGKPKRIKDCWTKEPSYGEEEYAPPLLALTW